MLQGFVAFFSLRGLCLRRIHDGPEFIWVAKSPVSYDSDFFNHSSQDSRTILLAAIDSDNVVCQNSLLLSNVYCLGQIFLFDFALNLFQGEPDGLPFQTYFSSNEGLPLNTCQFSYFHFADLNRGLNVGVVGHIRNDCLGVQTEGRLKCLYRFEIEMAHGDIGCRRSWQYAALSLFCIHTLAGSPQLLSDHGHVFIKIVVHVECFAFFIGIKQTDLDHRSFLSLSHHKIDITFTL